MNDNSRFAFREMLTVGFMKNNLFLKFVIPANEPFTKGVIE